MPSSQLVAIFPAARALARTAHAKDDATFEHGSRMIEASAAICDALGCDATTVEQLKIAALLHDVGKCTVPDTILFKPGRLDAVEIQVMADHSASGHNLLAGVGHPWFDLAADVALMHHERHDGSGYPRGLAGDAIPVMARIIAVADVYDALRADRPYKKGITHDEAMQVMTRGDERTRPGHFHPDVMAAFAARSETIRRIYVEHDNQLGWDG
ncbi:HD-GYP domain-containing protein [Ferrovibrio sp.]|uniref:HD-GYP domain-containing protein n=1 Tax=Ferrovibrio sp. TaxID=1917215 RepID=UPI0035B2DC23